MGLPIPRPLLRPSNIYSKKSAALFFLLAYGVSLRPAVGFIIGFMPEPPPPPTFSNPFWGVPASLEGVMTRVFKSFTDARCSGQEGSRAKEAGRVEAQLEFAAPRDAESILFYFAGGPPR